jgi:hypothetical protein
MVSGLWDLVSGFHAYGFWFLVSGFWLLGFRFRFLFSGTPKMVSSLLKMVSGFSSKSATSENQYRMKEFHKNAQVL